LDAVFEGPAMRFSLKPVFIGWLTLLTQIPAQLFFTLWAGLFFGGMSSTFLGQGSSAPFLFFGGLAFFGLPLITFIGKKLNYARTEYKFSPDRLEFEEGYFSLNKKVIMLKDVREVTLRRGFFQRSYGLGSIYLATLATGSSPSSNAFTALGFGNVSASGIIVRDIPNPDENYRRVMQLVEKSR
jgi:membrane protein YdbS with pleckstrin-like domain